MKTKLILLFTLIYTLSYAQTFDWSNANDIGTIVSQNINGIQIQYSNSSNNVNEVVLVDGNGFRGSTGNVVTSGGSVVASATFTFNSPVNIQTIYSFDDSSHPQADWTFVPTGGSNSNVVATIPQYSANNVSVNWTNVTSFEVTSSTANSSFGFDDIVFTPYVAPCIVNIPDTNFKAALLADTAINTNGNTEIECSEASAYNGVIHVGSLSISDLTGIEAFTNITDLNCQSNNLTSLDVSANNALTRINVTNNALTSLNVANGNNTNIVGGTFTTDGNPDLTCIQVDNIAYSTTNWIYIDVQTSFSTNCSGGPVNTIYVNHAATGNNDGTTWADAYTNLHSALNNASSVDDIWVAKGTYKPHTSDRDVSFIVNNSMYGGFAGTEASFSARDISLIHTINATLLDGDLLSDDDATVDFNDSTRDDNSKHVVEVATNNLEINGFTIQNGYADATSGDDRFGGGIFKEPSVPNLTIKYCNIKNNIALAGAGLALTATSNSNIIIDACTIENNLANAGAGLDYHLSGSNAQMNIIITNCLFNNNKTDDDLPKSRIGVGAAAARMRAQFSTVSLYVKLVNNTIVNNSCLGDVNASGAADFPVIDISRGGGDLGDIDVANNIFWANVKHNGTLPLAIGTSNGGNSSITSISANHSVVNNIDEEGFSSFFSTPQGTVTTNPLFTSTTDFTLQSGSPAVNGGSNIMLPSGITVDLLGNQRIVGISVDRGAYEYDSSLGIEDNELLENFKLYPNPVRNTLNIQLDETLEKVEVYSLKGQKVLESINSNVNVSNLSSGMYLIKVYTEEGKVGVKRFIKQD